MSFSYSPPFPSASSARGLEEDSPPALAPVDLEVFLASAGTLTLAERKRIVDQALILIESNYVHLPLKTAMHAVNPVQRLRLLRLRLQRQSDATMSAEWLFHREMSTIFHSVRDLHTNYLLPAPFAGMFAFLPFMIEKFHDDGVAHYMITRTTLGFAAEGFGVGVEVTHWNGIPIARAEALNGARFAGSNEAANLARGLDSLTLRPLRVQLPPDEYWVTVRYFGLDEVFRETTVRWQVAANLPPITDDGRANTSTAASLGLDLDADEKTRAKKLLYAPAVVELEAGRNSGELAEPVAVAPPDLPTTMPGIFRARRVHNSHGTFGYVRIFTFSVSNPEEFRDEFVRLIGLLPQNGLIVDVRANGGGHIYASEFLLQTLSPHTIAPEPAQFLSTPVNLDIVRRHRHNPTGLIDLGPWFDSLEQAPETGATYSAAHPITPVDEANAVGQTYTGPVVLITDARCYSATDIFAAGFADHRIGTILGVDDNTGAGGANVWDHALLSHLMAAPDPGSSDSPYRPLPNGANMRVAIRRTLRVGALAGTPVEDLGVRPDVVHRLTHRDLLEGNGDLLDAASALLATMPVHALQASISLSDSTATLALSVIGIDRVDLYLDGRPYVSHDVSGPTACVTIRESTAGRQLTVRGLAAGQLVAVCRLNL